MKDTARPDRQKLIAETPRLGRPPMAKDLRADKLLYLRITSKRKTAYVRAARGESLAAWCFRHLDLAAGYDPSNTL